MFCEFFIHFLWIFHAFFIHRHDVIQLALHTPRIKHVSGIQSSNPKDETINSMCYQKYSNQVTTKCIPKQDGTDLDVVLDCSTYLLHFKPSFICHGVGHKEQTMKYMYWNKKQNRLYYHKKDQIVDKLDVWTPRTPQQTKERGRFSLRKKITHACLQQLLSMALNC